MPSRPARKSSIAWTSSSRVFMTNGPYVMNTRDELVQAMEDFRAGRLGTVPADGLRPYRG